VSEKFGVELSATVTFDHPTVHALALHIAARLGPADAAVQPSAAAAIARQAITTDAQHVAAQLHAAVAELLGYAVQPDQPLMEAGLDSIGMHADLLMVCSMAWHNHEHLTRSTRCRLTHCSSCPAFVVSRLDTESQVVTGWPSRQASCLAPGVCDGQGCSYTGLSRQNCHVVRRCSGAAQHGVQFFRLGAPSHSHLRPSHHRCAGPVHCLACCSC